MRNLIASVSFLVIAVSIAGADDDTTQAAKKLEGSYSVVAVLVGGKPDKKGDEVKSFVIKGGTITIDDGKRKEEAKFTLDPSKKPAHIDIDPGKGDRPVPGIYETKETDKGLELTIAFEKSGKPDRPKDFKGEGERAVVLKLLRKK